MNVVTFMHKEFCKYVNTFTKKKFRLPLRFYIDFQQQKFKNTSLVIAFFLIILLFLKKKNQFNLAALSKILLENVVFYFFFWQCHIGGQIALSKLSFVPYC